MKKFVFSSVFIFFGISIAFSQWYKPFLKPFRTENIAEIFQSENGKFQYEVVGSMGILGPFGGRFDSEGQFYYLLDPSSQESLIYDKTFKFKGSQNFGNLNFRSLDNNTFISYTEDRLIVGNSELPDSPLKVYQKNIGLIGEYYFGKIDIEQQSDFSQFRTVILSKYAFYFDSVGNTYWTDDPMDPKKIKDGTYREFIHRAKDLDEPLTFQAEGKLFSLKSDGILYVERKPYIKSWQNLWNSITKHPSQLVTFNTNARYLGRLDSGYLWAYDNNWILLTDIEQNPLGLIRLLTPDDKALVENSNNKSYYWGSPSFDTRNGLFVLTVDYQRVGYGFEAITTFSKTNITKILPNWNVPNSK